MATYLDDVVGDVGTSVVVRRLPLDGRRALGDVLDGRRARLARLAVRVLGNEDTGRLGRLADARLVLGHHAVLVLRTLYEVVVRLLRPADRLAVHFDEARAVSGRPFHVVALDLRAAVKRWRLPRQRTRTVRQVLDSQIARWSRRI